MKAKRRARIQDIETLEQSSRVLRATEYRKAQLAAKTTKQKKNRQARSVLNPAIMQNSEITLERKSGQ
jgi:hypothetical protein